MKTEQERIEQIEKMAQAMCVFYDENKHCVARDDSLCSEVKCQCCGYKESAKRLIRAGYGDVSEYKAEIERLRTTLGQCNTELNSALESLKSQCREIGELKAATKQAQIDVLNELRERITKDRVANDTVVINANYEIDELIKEIRVQ